MGAFMFLYLVVNGIINQDVTFEEQNLSFEYDRGVAKVRYPGLDITAEIGAPELPVKGVIITLPIGATLESVRVVSENSREWAGEYEVSWCQPPLILTGMPAKKVVRKADIYQADELYPEKIFQYQGGGICDDRPVVELLIYPVQYRPRSKKIVFHDRLRIEIKYQGGIERPSRTGIVKELAINKNDLGPFFEDRDPDQDHYLIITEGPLDTVFQRLADWKTKKGVKASVRTKTWITANYAGEDDAARIRNYLKTVPDSGVEYVLLGGDTDVIPCRFAYAMTCSAGFYLGREDTMPADLYYADLQDNWNFDNDGSYGEIEDSVDLYPDLFVGRAPVNTIVEAQRFIDKILMYEKNLSYDYFNNALFTAEILWQDPYTDQGVHKNQIGNTSFPASSEVTKLYQSLGNETKESVMEAMRSGQGLINHDGHGWIDLISVGGWPHRIYNGDFDTLTNTPRLGILYSIGCWTAAFDSASVAEAFVNSPGGGGVAYIGNSSYGWGSPGNPGFGYSDRFDSRFFYSLFNQGHWHLGPALSLAKAHFIPFSREKNVYRWHQYQINLLGDPELPVWTESPESLGVQYPVIIPPGSSRILFTVKNKATGRPVERALVCLMKGTESYDYGYTDASGMIYLDANPVTIGSMDLTVTAHNCFCEEKVIPVISGAYVNFQNWSLNDMFGNGDSIVNPNEDILLSLRIKNCGNSNASNIQLRLRDSSPLTEIIDSSATVGSLNPGDSVLLDNAFGIRFGNVQNGDFIDFELSIRFNSQQLNFYPVIRVGAPMLSINTINVRSPTLPGETESLYVDLRNRGFGYGHATWGRLTSDDVYVSVISDGVWFGEVPPETTKSATQPAVIHVSAGCPASYMARLPFTIHSDDAVFYDTLNLLIGNTGFADDLESGGGLWTTGGTGNLWHISTRKSFSPTHAWYCGDENNGVYNDGMNCYIQTIPFMVQANSLLRFRRQFSVPLYGSDGIYVIVNGFTYADTLDFIGTGGALEKRGITSDWFEEKYTLEKYPAGDTIQFRIAFVSDSDVKVGEGFYIDDIYVEHISTISEDAGNPFDYRSDFLEVIPNPACSYAHIKYGIGNGGMTIAGNTRLEIFDISGRLVRSYDIEKVVQNRESGIIWRGTDASGRSVPAGVYFVKLVAGSSEKIRKMIFLR